MHYFPTVYIIVYNEVLFFQSFVYALASNTGDDWKCTSGADWVMLEVDGRFEPLGPPNFDAMLSD